MNNSESTFIILVQRIFAYLISMGFRVSEVESNVLYTKVVFQSKHVVIAISHDVRENVYDCYVGKVINGEVQVDRRRGGYWSPLLKYLIDFWGYRGGLKLDPDVIGSEPKQVYEYDALLKQYGKKLLEDSEHAFEK